MSEAVKFYSQLKAAFKYLVPMGVATNQSQPYVETNYSLPNFEQCRFSFLVRNDVINFFFPRHCGNYDTLGQCFFAHGYIWSIVFGHGLRLRLGYQRGESLVWYYGRLGCVCRVRGWHVEIVDVKQGYRFLFSILDS